MPQAAITFEVLPARFGDCLLVSCPVGRGTWRMLVDTGPDEAWPALRERLEKIRPGRDGQRHIDVLVFTHIDHDHIGGAAALLRDTTLRLAFGDVWFNAPALVPERGVAEAQSLAEILAGTKQPLPWNNAFGRHLAQTGGDGASLALPMPRGAPRLTLLSPTPQRLAALFERWQEQLARLRRKAHEPVEPAPPAERGAGAPDLETLAARVTPPDRSVPNSASLALLLEHRGARVLLAGDAVPGVLAPALQDLARQRGLKRALAVDVFKLSHHGSRASTDLAVLAAVQARHYVVSTDNSIFRHPDDETIARVALHGGRTPTLWFNYTTPRNQRWADAALRARYGLRTRFPTPGRSGIVLRLPARIRSR